MKERELTNTEVLQVITEMIKQAKRNVATKGSYYFLLWGWIVFIGNLGHYLIARYDWWPQPHMIWLITIPGIVLTLRYHAKLRYAANVSTQIDRVYGNLWLAIFVALATVLIFMNKVNYHHNAVILLLAGLGTFVTGRLLRFVPLVIGGVALWVGAIVAFKVSIIDQYLVGAIAIFIGYMVPGYLLKRQEGGINKTRV